MIYIPELWKEEPKVNKPMITVWAEESTKLEVNKYEWSFGNGLENSSSGYTMMADGRVIRAGLSVGYLDASVSVSLTINEQDSGYTATKHEGYYSGVDVYDIPLELHMWRNPASLWPAR